MITDRRELKIVSSNKKRVQFINWSYAVGWIESSFYTFFFLEWSAGSPNTIFLFWCRSNCQNKMRSEKHMSLNGRWNKSRLNSNGRNAKGMSSNWRNERQSAKSTTLNRTNKRWSAKCANSKYGNKSYLDIQSVISGESNPKFINMHSRPSFCTSLWTIESIHPTYANKKTATTLNEKETTHDFLLCLSGSKK